MVIWSILCGALLGALWPGYGDWRMYAGAFLGFLAGLPLRWLVRREIQREIASAVSAAKINLGRQTPAAPTAAAAPAPSTPAAASPGAFRRRGERDGDT